MTTKSGQNRNRLERDTQLFLVTEESGLVRMYFALPQMADRQCHLLLHILNLPSFNLPVTLSAYIRGRVCKKNKDYFKGCKRL